MSYYDPFRLYYRSQAKSHKGQILRKKYYPYQGLTLSDDDIKRVLETLENLNYRIFAPGEPLPIPPTPLSTHFQDVVFPFYTQSISFPASGYTSIVKFALLWDHVYDFFSSLLNIDPQSVSNFSFTINVISINIYGQFTFENETNGASFGFYFEDQTKKLYVPDGYNNFVSNSTNNQISPQSIDNSSYLATAVYQDTDPTTYDADSRANLKK